MCVYMYIYIYIYMSVFLCTHDTCVTDNWYRIMYTSHLLVLVYACVVDDVNETAAEMHPCRRSRG